MQGVPSDAVPCFDGGGVLASITIAKLCAFSREDSFGSIVVQNISPSEYNEDAGLCYAQQP
eukprot:6377823-Pyramimonas_sp.AAC.1